MTEAKNRASTGANLRPEVDCLAAQKPRRIKERIPFGLVNVARPRVTSAAKTGRRVDERLCSDRNRIPERRQTMDRFSLTSRNRSASVVQR